MIIGLQRRCEMRIGFKTTIEETLIKKLKIKALQKGVNVNDILEKLIDKYLKGEIKLEDGSK